MTLVKPTTNITWSTFCFQFDTSRPIALAGHNSSAASSSQGSIAMICAVTGGLSLCLMNANPRSQAGPTGL